MPKEMERALKKEAHKKGLTGERADAYIYGTMRKTGWTPHKRGTGGGGGSPCKIEKREGGMTEDEMMMGE